MNAEKCHCSADQCFHHQNFLSRFTIERGEKDGTVTVSSDLNGFLQAPQPLRFDGNAIRVGKLPGTPHGFREVGPGHGASDGNPSKEGGETNKKRRQQVGDLISAAANRLAASARCC